MVAVVEKLRGHTKGRDDLRPKRGKSMILNGVNTRGHGFMAFITQEEWDKDNDII